MNLFNCPIRVVFLCLLTLAEPLPAAESFLHFPAKDSSGQGRKIVLIAGDDEYRSEEGLPMLGKILSQRHGFGSERKNFKVSELDLGRPLPPPAR